MSCEKLSITKQKFFYQVNTETNFNVKLLLMCQDDNTGAPCLTSYCTSIKVFVYLTSVDFEEGRVEWNKPQLAASSTHILHNHCCLHKTPYMILHAIHTCMYMYSCHKAALC